MKRFGILILMSILFLSATSLAEGMDDIELTKLNGDELNTLSSDIEEALESYHETNSDANDAVLEATKAATESYFSEQGIEITWAWVDYSYSRDWDFYTLSTHIDYKDATGIKQKPGVYSEVFCENGKYNVYYLRIGTDDVIDRRDELPDELWSSIPEGIVNAATGLDLSKVSRDELEKLKGAVKDEYSANHSPNSTISDLVLSMTKLAVEQRFSEEGLKVSWPWLDYTYTRDWDLYTLTTSIDCNDTDGEYQSKDVYAEAYPFSGQYALCYLTVGDNVLVDERDQLPETFYSAEVTEMEEEPPIEREPEDATDSKEIAAPEETVGPEEMVGSEEGSMDAATAAATAEPEPIRLERGSKGDDVKRLQQRLLVLGLLDGAADGDFGKKTAGAVEALQAAHGLEVTGVFTNAEEVALSEDMREYAKRAIQVAMTNAQSLDVFTADGNAYDPSKFHNYAYTAGMYAALWEDGSWSQKGQDTWHVEDILLKLQGVENCYMKLTLDVRFDGENFVLSHVSRTMGRLEYLDSNDPSKLNMEEMEPSDADPYLTVPSEYVRDDRDKTSEEPAGDSEGETAGSASEDAARKEWIDSQFSIWDGSHKQLTKLIKKNLNDESSYKHIDTNYIDVVDETVRDIINSTLKGMGLSQRVEVGDLLITTEFSAKNAFNARIKATAYGIASYSNGTIELIAVE